MTPLTIGQRVEWKDHHSHKIFHGNLLGWIANKHYAWVDGGGFKGIVLAERLKHSTAGLLYLGTLDGPA